MLLFPSCRTTYQNSWSSALRPPNVEEFARVCTDRLKSYGEEMNKRQKQASEELDGARRDLVAMDRRLKEAQVRIQQLEEDLKERTSAIAGLHSQVEVKENEVRRLAKQTETFREEISKLVTDRNVPRGDASSPASIFAEKTVLEGDKNVRICRPSLADMRLTAGSLEKSKNEVALMLELSKIESETNLRAVMSEWEEERRHLEGLIRKAELQKLEATAQLRVGVVSILQLSAPLT